jgi:Protein of unknown function (DUF1353)
MKYKSKTFWLFVTHEDERVMSDIEGISFDNQLLKIDPGGELLIKGTHIWPNGKSGYAWDGCSPKRSFIDIVWGTPDGTISAATEKPKTYYASMFHDVLYQIGKESGVTRSQADKLFLQLMKKEQFAPRYLYYLAVRAAGWLWWGGPDY